MRHVWAVEEKTVGWMKPESRYQYRWRVIDVALTKKAAKLKMDRWPANIHLETRRIPKYEAVR